MGRDFSYYIVKKGQEVPTDFYSTGLDVYELGVDVYELRNAWDGPVSSFRDGAYTQITREELFDWFKEYSKNKITIDGWEKFNYVGGDFHFVTIFVTVGEILANMESGDTVIINYG